MMDPLISAILDAVFATLADSVGLSDWLRQRLKGDPEKLAFRAALTQALTAAAAQFPGRDVRYFAEVLPQIGGPLLARYLQPAAPLPTGDELTHLWLNHLTIDSAIHYRQDFAAFAAFLLDQLNQQIENQQSLQWIVQARRQRSSDEVTRRLAETAVQSAATLDALRQEVTQLTAALETALKTGGARISTGGGSYISGSVETGGDFIGRDKVTIKNYFVAGLARLVIDYGPRIQDFLLEYLGSKRKRVPFGGRQAQLDELHAWLDDSVAPPYYLMTAEAGRGKSALVCRWLAQLTARPDLDVIFVPISIRFETATQDVVFAALAARLANLYESEPEKLPPASLTAEQWKGVCQSYLRRSPPEGKQLLVILDGLDEATGWTPGRGLFSADPPPGLRVLVTARTRPGETGSSGWATTLGWDNAQLARTATLPGLQRRGVEEALASMGNPLDTLATKVDVVGELHRLSEGDPLLVRLYVDALLAQGPAVTTLRSEELQHIQPGLAGYFERWWQDQQEQWRIQGRDPIVEQAQLRLLLNAIAAALGPLLLDDLAALHPDLADSMLVRRLLQQVSRWLVGDGKTQGYSYSHPRLEYYFWEQLGSQEQRAWDARFCDWGERVLAELNAGVLAPKDAPRYLPQHYAAHLERSYASAAAFYALISNGWRRAWEELDVSYGGFLNDVDRVWVRTKQAYNSNLPGRAEALVQQVRSALCWSSVVALGRNLKPELLAQLVSVGLRTPVQALAIVKLLSPDEAKQAKMLVALAPQLPATYLTEIMEVTCSIRDEDLCSSVLIALAPRLPDELLERALTTVRTFRDRYFRVSTLCGLMPYLPKHHQETVLKEALAVAWTIISKDRRTSALTKLISQLPELQSKRILKEALETAQEISNEVTRLSAFCELSTYLSDEQRVMVLKEALVTALAIDDKIEYVGGLGLLANYLPEKQRIEVLNDALVSAQGIEDEHTQAAALSRLVPYLPPNRLWDVIAIAQSLIDEDVRASLLNDLAPYLPKELLQEALKITRKIMNEYTRASILGRLAPCFLETLATEALAEVRAIQFEPYRAPALTNLAMQLPKEQQMEILEEALASAQMTNNAAFRSSALSRLVPYLPDNQRVIVLQDALNAARMIEDNFIYICALIGLAPSLTTEMLIKVLALVNTINSEDDRATALGKLAFYLPETLLREALIMAEVMVNEDARAAALVGLALYLPEYLLEEALRSARAIKTTEARAAALKGIAAAMTYDQQILVLDEALKTAYAIPNEFHRVVALAELVEYFSEEKRTGILRQVLVIARSIDHEILHSSLLRWLAPYFSEELITEALSDTNTIKANSFRTTALIGLAPYLSKEQAFAVAETITDECFRAFLLSEIAASLSVEKRTQILNQVLDANESFQIALDRAVALRKLIPYVPDRQKLKILEKSRKFGSFQALVLTELALHLPEGQRFVALKEALVAACMMATTGNWGISVLQELAPLLVNWCTRDPCAAYGAWDATLQILYSLPRPEFLQNLAPLMPFILALAGDEAPEAAAGIYQAIQEVCAWWP